MGLFAHSSSHTDIRYKQLHFVICDSPTDTSVQSFIEACVKSGVTALVRVSEKTYDSKPIEAAGIKVYDLEFPDGSAPDAQLRDKWVTIIKENLRTNPKQEGCIAVHCVHGLGRSPLLVALALREAGMGKDECVDFVRTRRRGSFNVRQLEYLQKYQANNRLADRKLKRVMSLGGGENGNNGSGNGGGAACCIM